MPVTKTAKRALRSSSRKQLLNKKTVSQLEISIRLAEKNLSVGSLSKAVSLIDRAVKKNILHKNKASRIKSRLAKLLPKTAKSTKTTQGAKSKATKKAK